MKGAILKAGAASFLLSQVTSWGLCSYTFSVLSANDNQKLPWEDVSLTCNDPVPNIEARSLEKQPRPSKEAVFSSGPLLSLAGVAWLLVNGRLAPSVCVYKTSRENLSVCAGTHCELRMDKKKKCSIMES